MALFLDTQSGISRADPISLPAPERPYVEAADSPHFAERIAFSPDLGIAPVDHEVRDVCAMALSILEQPGVDIVEDCPDLADAEDIFQTLRAAQFAAN